MTLGPLFFAAPWALAGLLALPALWWILRATPPAPLRAVFPPLRLLLGLQAEEETRRRAPPWLVIARMALAAILILGLARPSYAPPMDAVGAAGPVLIALDDGWTSAPAWSAARAAADAAASAAERAGETVYLLPTTARFPPEAGLEPLPAAEARARLARMEPMAWRPYHTQARLRLAAGAPRYARVLWVSDGLDSNGAQAFGRALAGRGPLDLWTPATPARAVTAVTADEAGLAATVRRAPGGLSAGVLAAETLEGRSLASTPFRFEGAAETAAVTLGLPPEIAARAARVRLVGEASAGAVRLLPAGAGRPIVGLIGDETDTGQALLSDLYYVERAISPFAAVRRGTVEALIAQGSQALIAPDAGRFTDVESNALTTWIERGGVFIRFAGPRLADAPDTLTPVRLLPNPRALGGAVSWGEPQRLAPFPEDSPFAGLIAGPDVVVREHALAAPGAEREGRVWARLTDGAPVITAAPKGRGLLVLFHLTAGPAWSDLPLSGLYVDMLRRTLAFAGRADLAAQSPRGEGEPWMLERRIDGFGALTDRVGDAAPAPAALFAQGIAGPTLPPGLYARAGQGAAALNAAGPERLRPLTLPDGARRLAADGGRAQDLAGPLLALATLLLIADLIVALAIAGRLPALRPFRLRRAGAAAGMLALVLALGPQVVQAQSRQAQSAALEVRLAYIRNGEPQLDRQTEAGLIALSRVLTERTAVEPLAPIGVDPERDDLSAFPILYWAAPSAPRALGPRGAAAIDRYMRLGGLLFVDTRDAGARASGDGPAGIMLRGIDAPPLSPVVRDHVLSKGFYLLDSFPGQRPEAQLWAEAATSAGARDGVASLMVGNGDWAAAWASHDGRYAPRTGDPDIRRRELAMRFGVNLVMVALTGNYKTDQVHVPALLERLGDGSALPFDGRR